MQHAGPHEGPSSPCSKDLAAQPALQNAQAGGDIRQDACAAARHGQHIVECPLSGITSDVLGLTSLPPAGSCPHASCPSRTPPARPAGHPAPPGAPAAWPPSSASARCAPWALPVGDYTGWQPARSHGSLCEGLVTLLQGSALGSHNSHALLTMRMHVTIPQADVYCLCSHCCCFTLHL